MSQQFVKGRTNNHLTWAMVDAADFATPESALSAATTIKIYGKVRGGTGINFVSSGTGSLTNDIQRVGASVLGLYTIALVKADLSDASNAWYDQYIIALSGTGAARQVLVVDGGIDASALSALQSRMSDVQSYLVALSGLVSDVHSAAILGASHASDAHSAVLIVQSRLSDLDSRLVSDLSDVISGITALSGAVSDAHSAATAGASRALVNQSRISDVQSYLVAMSDSLSDAHSDLKSAIGAITVTITASDVSDIASAVLAGMTFGSTISDIYSLLSDLSSNFNSRVPLEPAGRSQLSDLASDVKSNALLIQSRLSDLDSRLVSDLSDVLSAVAVGNSRVLLNQSRISDIASYLVVMSGVQSDVYSLLAAVNNAVTVGPVPANVTHWRGDAVAIPTNDGIPRVEIDNINGHTVTATSTVNMDTLSDIYSLLSDLRSDFQSRVPKAVATNSQLSDLVSDLASDLKSFIGAGVELGASSLSDLRSAIAATELDASDLSDIASAVRTVVSSDLSDILSAAQQTNSRALVNQSRVSDIYSLLSDANSDLASKIAGITVSLDASNISDIVSAVVAALPITSQVSDIYSLLQVDHNLLITGAVTITLTAPAVDADGYFELQQGSDYQGSRRPAFGITASPNLSTGTVAFIYKPSVSAAAVTISCAVSGAGGSTQTILVPFTKAQTAAMTPGRISYDLEFTETATGFTEPIISNAQFNVRPQTV